jgi:hypothetical protein
MIFRLAIAATTLSLLASGPVARATLSAVESGSATFVEPAGGQSVFDIDVNYDVVFNSETKLFTYLYEFTPLAGSPIGQFQINANYINSVLPTPQITLIAGAPYTLTGVITDTGTVGDGAVSWSWNPATTMEQLVGYTSYFAPMDGTGSLTAGAFSVRADPPIPSVPEASTIVAGALLLLPLGIGAVRGWRKEFSAV